MIGQKWESEIKILNDKKTGRKIKKLTSSFENVHFYFTENSFDNNNNEIYFYSTRGSNTSEKLVYNIIKMKLNTGEMTQLTEESEPILNQNITKTPDSGLFAYITGEKKVKIYNSKTGENYIIYQEKGNYILTNPSISPDKKYIGFCRNEDFKIIRGENYSGFKDMYYKTKDGRITLVYLDGSGYFDVYRDTHWVNHFQFSPVDSALGMFCHEGPWNLVTQRIWLIDFVSRQVRPCFRQKEEDSVGHEFFTREGLIFFDNRGPGHDGTITSDRTQAILTGTDIKHNSMVPYVGVIDSNDKIIKRIDMPYYCNHYHANPDNTRLVGDDIDDIVMIDISKETAKHEVLCAHNTSWRTYEAHCHPTWSWDGKKILYLSDEDGNKNLYLIEF
jgi:oligogalacturonide lyase